MCSHADVQDLALTFCLFESFIYSCSVSRLIALSDHVQLIQINMVCLEHPERCIEMFAHFLSRFAACLGSDSYLVTPVRKSQSELLLTVGVCSCCIVICHSAVERFVQDLYSFILAYTLDRQRSECILRSLYPGLSEYQFFHLISPSVLTISFTSILYSTLSHFCYMQKAPDTPEPGTFV